MVDERVVIVPVDESEVTLPLTGWVVCQNVPLMGTVPLMFVLILPLESTLNPRKFVPSVPPIRFALAGTDDPVAPPEESITSNLRVDP
jgi:hypothetical protein